MGTLFLENELYRPCLRLDFVVIFLYISGLRDLSEVTNTLKSDLDKQPQIRNYGYPLGRKYYALLYETQ